MENHTKNYILFNISNLISDCVKNKLKAQSEVRDKVKILLDLIEFEYSSVFTLDEKTEITDFYYSKTLERYETPYIDDSTKEFILNYASILEDIEKTKKLINSCCSGMDDIYERAIENADETLNKIKTEKNSKILEDIDLETENRKYKNKKIPLDSLLSNAKKKAFEINKGNLD